jgi:hypothetical protein
MVTKKHGLAVSETLSDRLLIALLARVDKNLTRVDVSKFAVLKNVTRSAIISFLFFGEAVDSDAVIRVVAVCGNEFSSSTNACNWIRLTFHNGRGRSKCVNHLSNLLNEY